VRCSHKSVSAVSSQSSVGRLPSRLLSLTSLESITTAPTVSDTWMDTKISSERERVSTNAVLSQEPQRRHQTKLGRQAAHEIVDAHVAGPPTTARTVSDMVTKKLK